MIITDNDIKLIFDSLEKNLENVEFNNSYFESYFEFLKYFEKSNIIDYNTLVIGSYLVYGWMPTILKNFNVENNSDEVVDILNKVKKNTKITNEEYFSLVKCVNNSIVGVSKLLHFISPYNYPIFDSRIKKYFKNNDILKPLWKGNGQNKDKDIVQYKLFKDLCEKIISHERFDILSKKTIKQMKLEEEITPMRMLENLFFTFGV